MVRQFLEKQFRNWDFGFRIYESPWWAGDFGMDSARAGAQKSVGELKRRAASLAKTEWPTRRDARVEWNGQAGRLRRRVLTTDQNGA
jgi:hypothetical protein